MGLASNSYIQTSTVGTSSMNSCLNFGITPSNSIFDSNPQTTGYTLDGANQLVTNNIINYANQSNNLLYPQPITFGRNTLPLNTPTPP